jgi:hypothetical protein
MSEKSSEIVFKTLSGSVYAYSPLTKEWARLERTDKSGNIRTEGDTCLTEPQIEVGMPAVFQMKPIKEGALYRLVMTSTVTEILSGASDGV